ncbi:MAG: hypothetical protein GJU76_07250 [Gallionella sp.]|nr:hypothetical protein [Gallionella sp.]
MKIVGDKLRDVALQSNVANEEDLFGRSAFNRYYYSAFLITRSVLKRRHAEWGKVTHSGMPSVVRSARKEILQGKRRAIQSGLSAGPLAHDTDEGADAAVALAELLEQAYKVRVTADYFPEEIVARRRNELVLCNTNISDAGKWSSKARHFCNKIESAWRQLGLI